MTEPVPRLYVKNKNEEQDEPGKEEEQKLLEDLDALRSWLNHELSRCWEIAEAFVEQRSS